MGKIRKLCLLDFPCLPFYDLSCYGFLIAFEVAERLALGFACSASKRCKE
jgi:hypothetical protein